MIQLSTPGLARVRRSFNMLHAKLGGQGWFGLSLAAAAIVVAGDCVALWQQGDEAEQRVALLMLTSSKSPHARAPLTPSHATAHFALPTLKEAPGIAAAIIRQSAAHEVPIQSAEYRYTRSTDLKPAEYEMTFDLHGRYLNARGFLQDVLDVQPAVGLREAKFYLEEIPGSGALGVAFRGPIGAGNPMARERELRVHVRLVTFLQDTT